MSSPVYCGVGVGVVAGTWGAVGGTMVICVCCRVTGPVFATTDDGAATADTATGTTALGVSRGAWGGACGTAIGSATTADASFTPDEMKGGIGALGSGTRTGPAV